MKITIATKTGLSLPQAVKKILEGCSDRIQRKAKRLASEAMLKLARKHVSMRYPGSHHWNPRKITSKYDGSIDISIAGATRAYHDITIRPVHASALTIPMHASAFGKKASSFSNLFTVPGKNALFMKKGGGIAAMFALVSKVHQKQDSTLLPSDQAYLKAISDRIGKEVQAEAAAKAQKV